MNSRSLPGMPTKAVRICKAERWIVGEELHLIGEMVGHPGVVAIEKSDIFAARVADGVVSGAGGALVFLLEVNELVGIRSMIGRQNFFQFGRIGRTVVDDDRFEVLDTSGQTRNRGRRR